MNEIEKQKEKMHQLVLKHGQVINEENKIAQEILRVEGVINYLVELEKKGEEKSLETKHEPV